MYDALDSDEYKNTIIYPTGDKAANREPYFSAYEYFSRCCEQAELLIVIGYSFRDYEALNRLMGRLEGMKRLRWCGFAGRMGADACVRWDAVDELSPLKWSVTPVAAYFGGDSLMQTKYLQA